MLLNNFKKNIVFDATLLIVTVFCFAQCAVANDDLEKNIQKLTKSLGILQPENIQNNKEYYTSALQAFTEFLESDDEETKELLKQWDAYLISVSHYSNADYSNAIQNQLTNYLTVIADIGDILEKKHARQKEEYSTSWIDALINRFGIDFVKNKKEVFFWSMRSIMNSDETYERSLKDLIYIEAMLYGSYKKYYGLFLQFYDTKNISSQKKLKRRKDIADAFLAIIGEVSLTSIHNDYSLNKIIAENKARQINDEIFMFLKNHPLAHTFEPLKALRDIKKVTEN